VKAPSSFGLALIAAIPAALALAGCRGKQPLPRPGKPTALHQPSGWSTPEHDRTGLERGASASRPGWRIEKSR